MKFLALYSHVVGTTGHHEKERRNHTYSEKCIQCGAAVDSTHRVAAHVLKYPYFNCCFGKLTLVTTCKSCNSKHTTRSSPRKSRIFARRSKDRHVNLGFKCHPLCCGPLNCDVSSPPPS